MSRAGPGTLPHCHSDSAGKKRRKETVLGAGRTINYAWGKRWRLPTEKAEEKTGEPPPGIKDKEFWKGSAFGVAVGARSFPGIIAIHANADYIFNFEKAIGVQTSDRGSRPPIGQ